MIFADSSRSCLTVYDRSAGAVRGHHHVGRRQHLRLVPLELSRARIRDVPEDDDLPVDDPGEHPLRHAGGPRGGAEGGAERRDRGFHRDPSRGIRHGDRRRCHCRDERRAAAEGLPCARPLPGTLRPFVG